MTTNIFITGDRSMDAMPAVGAVNALLEDLVQQHGPDIAIGTGNCATGIERAVRYLVPDRSMNIVEYTHDAEGKIDCTEAFETIAPTTDVVVFVHLDPLASRIGKALHEVFPEDKIRMPFQELLAGL